MSDLTSHEILDGVTLKTVVTRLVDHYGWTDLGERIQIRCFTHDPSVASSLKFLRKTDWARLKVEQLYVQVARQNLNRWPDAHG